VNWLNPADAGGDGMFGGKQFNFKNQNGIRRDAGASPFAISEFRRHKQLPLGTDLHLRERFRPTVNDVAKEIARDARPWRNCQIPCRQ
jgi:hypothetical protein